MCNLRGYPRWTCWGEKGVLATRSIVVLSSRCCDVIVGHISVSSDRQVCEWETELKHFRVHCYFSKQRHRLPNSCVLLGGARVSRLPEPGTAVSHTLVRRTHLQRLSRTDLRSARPCASPLEEVWAGLKSIGSVRCGN